MLDINSFIDERNRDIYTDVISQYTLSLEHSSDESSGVWTRNWDAVIFIPKGTNCIDSFSHELLHLYLEKNGYGITATLLQLVLTDPLLSEYYERKLIEHIGNCLVHSKMLPVYLDHGFKRENFLYDYHIMKCQPDRIKAIKMLFNNARLWNAAVCDFIATYFAMKADPNPEFVYTRELNELHSIDPKLFNTLDSFWRENEIFNPFSDEILNSYRWYTTQFIDDLRDWTFEKFQLHRNST